MTEIELKFQVPESSRHAVEAAVMTAEAKRTRLQAIYFDTTDRRLAAAGIAVRLRKEGRRWVQTVKAGGAHAMERLEHNVPITDVAPGALPTLDLERHANTPAAALLARALAPCEHHAAPQPIALYRTDIWRSHRVHRTRSGLVEIAFDEGAILAEDRRWPVCELEIELVSGSAAAVIDVAQRWVSQHGLWLDVRSKAERGDRLARDQACGPVHKHAPVQVRPGMTSEVALQTLLAGCLSHVLPNASEVASGVSAPEHLHQLRAGLSRLETALRLFEGSKSSFDPTWATPLSSLRRQLGIECNRQRLTALLQPLLTEAGGPASLSAAAEHAGAAAGLVRAVAVTRSLLMLQRFVSVNHPGDPADAPALHETVSERLECWHKQVRKAAANLSELDGTAWNGLRKRVKRLCAAIELTIGLHGHKRGARYLARLRPLQDALRRAHEVFAALQEARDMASREPRAWYAVGWFSAQSESLRTDCTLALKRFQRAKPAWRKR